MAERPSPAPSPDCRRCRHFYVTHDARWPYGCRAFAMKSRALPAAEVLLSSGEPCRGFAPREERPAPPRG
ncbi:MAG: hypothetical protein AB1726_17780 [Planctomycetota bacterium]